MDVELLWTLTIALALLCLVVGAGLSYVLTRAHYQAIIEELRKRQPS